MTVVEVTAQQVSAAKALLLLDKAVGRSSDAWTRMVAAARPVDQIPYVQSGDQPLGAQR